VESPSETTRRVVYLVPGLDHVCVRHRVDVFVAALQGQGWVVEKWVLPKGFLRRVRLFWRVRGADVVVVVRKLLRCGQLRFLRWCVRKLVFDFDDAIIYRDSSRAKQVSRARAQRFRRIVQASDRLIAGNAYLAELAEGCGGRVTVIPTCVDLGRLSPSETKRAGGKVVIGWIGSHSTLMYLETLRPVLGELARRYGESAVLKVVCDRFPKHMGLKVEEKPWALNEELRDLRTFDIGVMPLPDDAWTQGKCGFKLLEYMAVGIPVVASPVGVNTEIVRDGENGFLAGDEARWTEVLARLIEDVELRHRLGAQGWASLHGRYTVADWAGRYVQVIEEVAGLRPEVAES